MWVKDFTRILCGLRGEDDISWGDTEKGDCTGPELTGPELTRMGSYEGYSPIR